jgi:hypothetical protein
MSVILVKQEAEIRRIMVRSQLQANSFREYLKNTQHNKGLDDSTDKAPT